VNTADHTLKEGIRAGFGITDRRKRKLKGKIGNRAQKVLDDLELASTMAVGRDSDNTFFYDDDAVER
jgi:hypothetical protein